MGKTSFGGKLEIRLALGRIVSKQLSYCNMVYTRSYLVLCCASVHTSGDKHGPSGSKGVQPISAQVATSILYSVLAT